MEISYRFISGLTAGLCSLFAPAAPLVCCAALFIAADFLSGVAASRAATLRRSEQWYFESREAWRTVVKAGFVFAAILLTWLVDRHVLGFMESHLANLFTGFTCGVELWSLLENAAQLSDAPLFRWLQRYVRRRIGKEAGDE